MQRGCVWQDFLTVPYWPDREAAIVKAYLEVDCVLCTSESANRNTEHPERHNSHLVLCIF